ncbi:MAG: DMT family transporter [Pyrinomonadaceae bacterium]
MSDQHNRAAAYLALVVVEACFGSLPVLGKMVLAVMPAISLVGFRVGITALALAAFQIFRGRVWLRVKGDYWRLAVLSLFGVTFNQLLFVTGLSLTKAANTSLLSITIPIFALSVGASLGVEKIRPLKALGIFIAAAGVILLLDPRKVYFSSQTTVGDMLIIVNSLSYGIFVATSKEIVTRNGALRSMMWVFIFAAVICVPLVLWSSIPVALNSVSATIWLLILYISIIATAMPYLLNAWALARVNPSTVAVFVYLQPLIGFSLVVIFLAEKVDFTFGVAAVLIFGGLYLVMRRHQSETKVGDMRIG